ncbi:microvitellogenin-like [Anticarsia gemmatalis]|uniref:microvitellogenin-like n=1 Tax=Anticarsia gemmatalis TaxID=129554 RepID=UPI003F7686CB
MFVIIIYGLLASAMTANACFCEMDLDESYWNEGMDTEILTERYTLSQIYDLVNNNMYEAAVNMTIGSGVWLQPLVRIFLTQHSSDGSRKIMRFAYELWNSGAKHFVIMHFPAPFQLILNDETVTIINKGYFQALKVDGEGVVWGDAYDKETKKVSWKIMPVLSNNSLSFKLYHLDSDTHLSYKPNTEASQDRVARFHLEPVLRKNRVFFYIVNTVYGQSLEMGRLIDSRGDRRVYGHDLNNDELYGRDQRFKWIISSWL